MGVFMTSLTYDLHIHHLTYIACLMARSSYCDQKMIWHLAKMSFDFAKK